MPETSQAQFQSTPAITPFSGGKQDYPMVAQYVGAHPNCPLSSFRVAASEPDRISFCRSSADLMRLPIVDAAACAPVYSRWTWDPNFHLMRTTETQGPHVLIRATPSPFLSSQECLPIEQLDGPKYLGELLLKAGSGDTLSFQHALAFDVGHLKGFVPMAELIYENERAKRQFPFRITEKHTQGLEELGQRMLRAGMGALAGMGDIALCPSGTVVPFPVNMVISYRPFVPGRNSCLTTKYLAEGEGLYDPINGNSNLVWLTEEVLREQPASVRAGLCLPAAVGHPVAAMSRPQASRRNDTNYLPLRYALEHLIASELNK